MIVEDRYTAQAFKQGTTMEKLDRRQRRVVIAQDMDLSALPALGGHDRASLVTLRPLDTDPDLVIRRLRHVLPQIDAALRQGGAVAVTDTSVRIRQLPIR